MLVIAQAIGRGNAKTQNFVENMLKKLELDKYNGHVPKDKWVQVLLKIVCFFLLQSGWLFNSFTFAFPWRY